LIENEVIRLREDEIKKIDDVMLKKMTAKTKKSAAAEKKRIHAKEMIIKKGKREEDKIIKKLKKISKSKRFYCRRLQNSSISVFSTSQMRKTAFEIEKSILQVEKSEVGSSASSMRNYVYQ
jgi:flagellar biosynthesis chaperone FliJ